MSWQVRSANERAADGIAILYGGSVKADNAKALVFAREY